MESLGNKLKEAREAKGYSCQFVGGETNIAVRYLEALEREDFSVFPGEPYLLGFLKNYGEYLGLEASSLLSMYRALKIQSEPVPVEQLLRSPSKLPKIIFGCIMGLLALGAGGTGAYFVSKIPRRGDSGMQAARLPVEYVMNTGAMERRFYVGDSILVPSGEDRYKLELARLGEAVTIGAPGGNIILDLSQEVTVDLNRDGLPELRITAVDFAKNDPSSGTLLRFELEAFYAPPSALAGNAQEGEPFAPELPGTSGAGLANAVVLFASPNPYPFTFQAAFQNYCMVRWEILFERDRRDRNEQYFQRSDELNIQAQNGIRLWVSNAQALKAQVIGGGRTAPLELGAAGEVVVADLRWIRDDDTHYRLVLIRLE